MVKAFAKLRKCEGMEECSPVQSFQNRGSRHASLSDYIEGFYMSKISSDPKTPSRKLAVLSESMTVWQRHVMQVPFWEYSLCANTNEKQENHKSLSNLSPKEYNSRLPYAPLCRLAIAVHLCNSPKFDVEEEIRIAPLCKVLLLLTMERRKPPLPFRPRFFCNASYQNAPNRPKKKRYHAKKHPAHKTTVNAP